MDLDLTGILELALDALGQLAGEDDHIVLAHLLGLDHHADLAARLNGVGGLDAGVGAGDLLELFEALDVVLDVLAAGAGTGGGDGVGGLHEAGDDGLRLDVVVVRLHRVDDVLALMVLAQELHAERDVGAFELVVDGLADIVQQAGALRRGDVRAELGCHHAGKMRDLDGVLEHVLTVARTVMQAAEQLHQLGVQAAHAGLEHRALTLGLDDGVHLAAGLGDHLLDVGGMDAAVGDQLFERQTCDLAATFSASSLN